MVKKLYKWLFLLSPWALMAGVFQYHFRSFLPAQRLFMGLKFFDFFTVMDIWVGLIFVVFVWGVLNEEIGVGGDGERGARRGDGTSSMPRELSWAVGLLLVAGLLQLLFQQVYEPVLSTPFEYFRSLFIFPLIYGVLLLRTLNEKTVKRLVSSYLWMVGLFCALALLQHFAGIFPGEQKDFMGRLVWPFVDFVTLESASANWVAFFVTPAVVLAFAFLFDGTIGASRRISSSKKIFLATIFALSGLTLYLAQSYGGYIAVFCAIVFYLFRALPFKKFVASFLLMGLLAGGVYVMQQSTWKYQVLTGEADYRFATSATSRVDIYKMGIHMVTQHPVLGVGMNQFQSYFAANQVEVLSDELNESHIPPHAHNFFLSMWTNLGAFAVIAMVVLLVGLAWRTKLAANHPALFVLIAIMVHGLIDSWYWKQEVAYLFWLMVVLSYRLRATSHSG